MTYGYTVQGGSIYGDAMTTDKCAIIDGDIFPQKMGRGIQESLQAKFPQGGVHTQSSGKNSTRKTSEQAELLAITLATTGYRITEKFN
jgi:hypothetical protein